MCFKIKSLEKLKENLSVTEQIFRKTATAKQGVQAKRNTVRVLHILGGDTKDRLRNLKDNLLFIVEDLHTKGP